MARLPGAIAGARIAGKRCMSRTSVLTCHVFRRAVVVVVVTA
jgi:hypothetical protein